MGPAGRTRLHLGSRVAEQALVRSVGLGDAE
jgi:hypothetical protein